MTYGILAGLCWAFETFFIGLVLNNTIFTNNIHTIIVAPFIATFFHDLISSFIMQIINIIKHNYVNSFKVLKSKSGKYLLLASIIGGPVGMCGYFLAINYLGSSIGALSSAIYPAIGAILAFLFLKEDMPWYRWLLLSVTIVGVFVLSYTPSINVTNIYLGLLGAFMCSFGWGVEGVILSKCMKDNIDNYTCLMIRQTTSFIVIGLFILPFINGYNIIGKMNDFNIFINLIIAGIFATISYLCYYKAINKIGVSKAMSLNICYIAYSIILSILFLKDYSLFTPLNIILVIVVILSSILTSINFRHQTS